MMCKTLNTLNQPAVCTFEWFSIPHTVRKCAVKSIVCGAECAPHVTSVRAQQPQNIVCHLVVEMLMGRQIREICEMMIW